MDNKIFTITITITRGLNNERLNKVSALNLLVYFKNQVRLHNYIQITMKPPCATFSDTRHVVQTTKFSFPTRSATENRSTKSWHFIYRLQRNFHVRPSRIRDMLFKLLNLVFLLELLLKTGPPNLGILYTDYKETSTCDLLGYATCCSNY